jgi:hypothetical protein
MSRIHVLRSRGLAALALALGLLATGSCTGPPAIRILWPAVGASLTRMPLSLVVDFAAGLDPGSLQVTLNGWDVTPLLSVEPPQDGRVEAWADFVWDPAFVLEGSNELHASIRDGAVTRSMRIQFDATGDAYADELVDYSIGAGGGFGQSLLPDVVLGPPTGMGLFNGSTDVLALGEDGWIELAFTDNAVFDGPGVDFTVFENAILEIGAQFETQPPFVEPARVSVSQDGLVWVDFPCALVPQPLPLEPPYYPGCAGVYPVLSDQEEPHASVPTDEPLENLVGRNALTLQAPAGAGGDGFDLADVGLAWIRYVRVQGADFVQGPVGPDNFGFDLDAVAAVSSVPATDEDGNGVPDALE